MEALGGSVVDAGLLALSGEEHRRWRALARGPHLGSIWRCSQRGACRQSANYWAILLTTHQVAHGCEVVTLAFERTLAILSKSTPGFLLPLLVRFTAELTG